MSNSGDLISSISNGVRDELQVIANVTANADRFVDGSPDLTLPSNCTEAINCSGCRSDVHFDVGNYSPDTLMSNLARQLDRSSFVPPRQHNADVPADLEKIILRCIERDPKRRYPFIGMMVRELQAALYV